MAIRIGVKAAVCRSGGIHTGEFGIASRRAGIKLKNAVVRLSSNLQFAIPNLQSPTLLTVRWAVVPPESGHPATRVGHEKCTTVGIAACCDPEITGNALRLC